MAKEEGEIPRVCCVLEVKGELWPGRVIQKDTQSPVACSSPQQCKLRYKKGENFDDSHIYTLCTVTYPYGLSFGECSPEICLHSVVSKWSPMAADHLWGKFLMAIGVREREKKRQGNKFPK